MVHIVAELITEKSHLTTHCTTIVCNNNNVDFFLALQAQMSGVLKFCTLSVNDGYSGLGTLLNASDFAEIRLLYGPSTSRDTTYID